MFSFFSNEYPMSSSHVECFKDKTNNRIQKPTRIQFGNVVTGVEIADITEDGLDVNMCCTAVIRPLKQINLSRDIVNTSTFAHQRKVRLRSFYLFAFNTMQVLG
jgi:hypothetical protein